MTIILDSIGLMHDKPIAIPCFRIGAALDGHLNVETSLIAAKQIYDIFTTQFSGEIRFALIEKKRAQRGARATKATSKKVQNLKDALWGGMVEQSSVRFYGTDENPLNAPFLPFLSISNRQGPVTEIEISVPWDTPDLLRFADAVHTVLCDAPVRFGYQGMGFGKTSLNGLDDFSLPMAHERFRTALMGTFNRSPDHLLFRKVYIVNSKVPGMGGEYSPGVGDTGWRTYVGAAFRDRLGDVDIARAKGVRIDEFADVTVVTAGPEPIWGDVNRGEDISAFVASYAYLRPAYADMKNLCKGMWRDNNAADTAASRGYFERLAKGMPV